MKAELVRSAAGPSDFPTDGLPEVAVLGRSNVGKSSFINALVGRKRLARTSGRPGKTRRIHFFRIEDALYLVDLPGFGYAAVSRAERRSWRPMAEAYLRASRAPLVGAIVLVDVRRGLETEERGLFEWLGGERIEPALVLTKSDKLSHAKAASRLAAETSGLGADRVALASSRTGRGLATVAVWIRDWTGLVLRRPDGTPLVEPGSGPPAGGC